MNVPNALYASVHFPASSSIDAPGIGTALPCLTKSPKPQRPKIEPGPYRPGAFGITHESVWGVYVNDGCVSAEDPLEWRDVEAHAHVHEDDQWRGWICIAGSILTASGNPSHLLLHEVAHCIRGGTSHDAKWRRIVTDLGAGREAKKYERKRTSTPVVASPVAQP